MALSTEKKKQIAAGVLGVLALTLIIWSVFFSDDSGSSSSSQATKTPPNKPGINSPINQATNPNVTPTAGVMLVSQPLDLGGLGDATTPVMGRNIFIYPPPPTPKPIPTPTPAPPPPPPPITLAGMNPSNVSARTAGFPMTVFGAKIPADARVLINGAQYPTTVVNESQVKVDVPQAAIANPGQLQIEVKSAADPGKWYSNRLTLNVSAPPAPAYRYLGLIVKNGISTAVIRDEGDSELKSVRKGDKLGRWQVISITPAQIEFLDVPLNIKHLILFEGEGK